MKAIILIEDTPRGITFVGDLMHNGCNDHMEQSLALLLLFNFQKKVEEMQKRNLLKIEKDMCEDDPPH